MAIGIIAGGGQGERVGSGVPKLEIEVLGRPLIVHTLSAFQEAGSIEEVIVTVPPGSLEKWHPAVFHRFGITKVRTVIAGGATRQESVFLGLKSLHKKVETVVIHDGARPLVSPEMIDSVCTMSMGEQGIIYGVPLTDTVKRVESGYVGETLDRHTLVAVQTPQAFLFEVIFEAHRRAVEEGFTGTDDSMLVERTGGRVRVVEGHPENVKVTYPEDIMRVEAVLQSRSVK
ncbi:MAG: 2-C-methyl-D-erythritol 4-phosphate cytidylyltransferase [Actinobacteria bacterium]|nr:2-C-methyl-D-erythritol 4-phosphate cytidylyltransferase [Actinomycetota bacterium]